MSRSGPASARPRKVLRRDGLPVALAFALAVAPALAIGIAPAAAQAATDTVYRFPFDPLLTTPAGGEFASRLANGEKRAAPHRGHDFAFDGAEGAAIPAIAAGIVRGKSRDGSLGNCVAIEHADGAFSAYCHMAEPSALEVGSRVELGSPVGAVGGSPDVPVHLHLAMGWSLAAMSGIDTFDPIPYIRSRLSKPTPTPTPGPEPDTAPQEPARPAAGLAVTHSFPTAV